MADEVEEIGAIKPGDRIVVTVEAEVVTAVHTDEYSLLGFVADGEEYTLEVPHGGAPETRVEVDYAWNGQ